MEFYWFRPRGGFTWDGGLLTPRRLDDFSVEPVFMPGIDDAEQRRQFVVSSDAPVYAVPEGLFYRFAHIPPDADGIREFADKYGPLTNPLRWDHRIKNLWLTERARL